MEHLRAVDGDDVDAIVQAGTNLAVVGMVERASAELGKPFHSSGRAKLGFGVAMYHGNGLDRFSKFELGRFGVARVPGYGGEDIRFHTGGALNLNGAFALSEKTRMDMSLIHARFRDLEDLGPDVEHATGGSVALNFSGPFNAFMRVRVGYALDSSVDIYYAFDIE